MTTAACFVKHTVVPDVVAHAPNHMLEVGKSAFQRFQAFYRFVTPLAYTYNWAIHSHRHK
jgi:hypothetical protein